MRFIVTCVLCMMWFASTAHASALTAADLVRARQCGPQIVKPTLPRFERDDRLDRAADRLARGDGLDRALERAKYRARRTTSIRLSGYKNDAALANVLAIRHCDRLVDPAFTTIGYAKRGNDAWLVLAEPFRAPPTQETARVRLQVLQSVNDARAQPRRCGKDMLPAAPTLLANDLLDATAANYATQLARRGTLSHEGADGSSVADRARARGYVHRLVGENLAFGPATAREVVDGWLASPGHCENIMNRGFVHMGLGFATDAEGPGGVYWVQVLGR